MTTALALLLAISTASADPTGHGDDASAIGDAHATATSPPLERASAHELHGVARGRIERGDYEGARILLEQAVQRPDADPEEALYLTAVSWELEGDPGRALAIYDEGIARWPAGSRADDLRFRRAEALGTLGRYREALRALEFDGIDRTDALKVDLVRGIWEVERGKRRKGLRTLGDALGRASSDDVTFYQAKARAVITRDVLAQGAALTLDVGERKQARRLEQRAALIKRAERQVTAIALLEEPEWIFDGMLTLGGAYEAVGDDLLAARVPRLDADQRAIYDDMLRQHVEIVFVKAQRHYDRAIDVALRLEWESRRVGALHEARDAIHQKIEGLSG